MSPSPTLRVMTFNVRQPDQDDGPDAWECRRELLVETVLEQAPDVIGTQELFLLQAEYILSAAPQYGWFGDGRFGDHEDKHVGIFYRRDRIRVTSHATLWLSETPDVPGSSSWDIIRPRQATWAELDADGIGRFFLLNTHFPYRQVEQEARRRTARLVRERMMTLARSAPAILTGDFNSSAGGEIHQMLLDDFRDAWCDAAVRRGPRGTLNSFGRRASDLRIDWILYRGPWRVLDAETVTRQRNGRYPSDHFPVVATFATAEE